MTPGPPSAVLFDLDGTLIDSLEDIAACANATLEAMGLPPHPTHAIRRFIGDGLPNLLGRALRTETARLPEALAIYHRLYAAHALDRTRLYPGLAELIHELRGRPLALVTNKTEASSRAILDGLGILERFPVVIGGDTLPERKPSPRPLEEALARLGVPPREALMVGDGPQDLLAARAAGVPSCAVLWGLNDAATLEALHPDHVAPDVPALRRILLERGSRPAPP